MAASKAKGSEAQKASPTPRKRKALRTVVYVACSCLLVFAVGVAVVVFQNQPNRAFGLGTNTASIDTSIAALAVSSSNNKSVDTTADLTQPASRDISVSVNEIRTAEEEARRAAEEAIRAAEEALRIEEEATVAEVSQKIANQLSSAGMPDLESVDWTVGKVAFIAEWTERIDAYLAGSPLAGQGVTFATAAWNYCVDPRWSPAISMTESGQGANCFHYHNAWGWGSSSWSTWEEAIDAHVYGLSTKYGYTISRYYAKMYCPPTWENWYSVTLAQMKLI